MEKNITLLEFINKGGNLRFRRWLPAIIHEQWEVMRRTVLNQHCTDETDKISWKWTKNNKFSVKSTYEHLTKEDVGDPHSKIWKAKAPYKVKIFLWLLERGATLTKDNMIKRNWVGDPTCRFCSNVETTDHLFFQCPTAKVVWAGVAQCIGATNIPLNIKQYWLWADTHFPNCKQIHGFGIAAICWAIWKARNKACFERKLIKHPAEIICHACSFMSFWTGLYKPDFQSQLTEGVKMLLSAACRILASQHPPATVPLILPADDEEEHGGDI